MTQSFLQITDWLCSCGKSLIECSAHVVCSQCGLVQDHQKFTPSFDIVSQSYPLYKIDPRRISLYHLSRMLDITTTTEKEAAYLIQNTYQPLKNEFSSGEIVTGSLYLALRHRKENLELNRLIETAQTIWLRITRRKTLKCASAIRAVTQIPISPVKTEEYFPVIIGKIVNGEGFKLEQKARSLLNQIPEKELRGRNPYITAGAVIYAILRLYSSKPISQRRLAEKMNASQWSITCTYYNIIKPFLDNGG